MLIEWTYLLELIFKKRLTLELVMETILIILGVFAVFGAIVDVISYM